ncbi:flagellar export chaperone FliS [Desulfobulbus sp.]|uniref:flagellar export chaperone FliS n=1 Tax=Desulfobulbus sp. TaxID=895 RepID=UPI00286F5EFB|nr:flagellar export chaperone FliS [Desulfobulbus sp.]
MNAYTQNGQANQYLANSIRSASPEQLMLMLYDGAIRFLSQAIQAVEQHNPEQRALFINRASAIVTEFAATLDSSHNPELAENLTALYGYMLRRMMEANLKNAPEPLQECKQLLTDLRMTWTKAIALNKRVAHAPATMSRQPLAVAM